jgi:biotin carboxyl carrier protein
MDKDFADIIQRMADEQGKETLVNGTAKKYLADYCAGQFKKEAGVFRQILEAGCGEHINGADNVLERKRKLMERLEEDNSLSPKATAEYLDLLGLILKGDTSKCGETVPLANQPAPQPAKQQPTAAPQKATAAVPAAPSAAPVTASAPRAGAAIVPAPIEGTILLYTVSEGTLVNLKDTVLILGTMGMGLEIRATASGKVHFLVPVGTLVVSQQPLAEII